MRKKIITLVPLLWNHNFNIRYMIVHFLLSFSDELEYLCHLQAVVEILKKYKQLDYVLYQIDQTNKRPLRGNPIVAVPLRLELTPEQVKSILGY